MLRLNPCLQALGIFFTARESGVRAFYTKIVEDLLTPLNTVDNGQQKILEVCL